MNKNSIMLMQEINSIEILNDSKNIVKIVPGYFHEYSLSATACISPVHIADFIEVNKIGYLKINEILWKIEEKSLEDCSLSNFPPSFYEFTLSKV